MNRILHFIITILIFTSSVYSQNINDNKLTAEQWTEDIDYFMNGMAKVHINPYHTTSQAVFETTASELKSKLSGMKDNEIIAGIVKMVAMIGDGHTVIDIAGFHNNNNSGSVFNIHAFPLETYIFEDGVFVIYADQNNKELMGKKLIKINGTDIEAVIEKMKPIVPGDNEYNKKFSLPFFFIISEYLNGLNIIPDINETEFTFENKAGNVTVKNIKAVSLVEYFNMIHKKELSSDAPLYLQNEDKNYWFKYLEDSKTLYINYERVLIDPKDSLKYFCSRLNDFINSHDIDKTVIDIRNNGGGNNGTCQPFVDLISNNKKINVKGKLFTITGRRTFSAASYLCTKLEFNTNTIFAGEPTGAKPNHYGDNKPLILPNSKFTVRLSSIYWQNSLPFDKRLWTEPEIKAVLSSSDYFGNSDPVMNAISEYKFSNGNFAKVNSSEVELLTGKYIYQPLQLLEIGKDGNELKLEVRTTDFVGRDVSLISTNVYAASGNKFITGISGFDISKTESGLMLSYKGTDWEIQKAESDYKLPAELISDGKLNEAINLLKETKANFPDNAKVSENEINSLGYVYVNNKNLPAAIELFKLNTELYPEAFNTFDSLGEAYLLTGENELALVNYKRSVELNDKNENAKKVIERLQSN